MNANNFREFPRKGIANGMIGDEVITLSSILMAACESRMNKASTNGPRRTQIWKSKGRRTMVGGET